ncbi:TonB-dependent receptor [Neptuniibacter sp. QD29_5]|uniref:TonB-dependent receptor n=1 Tax=Neptuniibacter sp. QD29_5 TaxID=3398207 RepID=UPI0039F49DAC
MKSQSLSIKFPLNTLAVAVFSASVPHTVFAADEVVSTMVVTASRVDEESNSLPVSVSAIDDKQLQLDQGAHIQDSTRMMAGVTINQLSGSSSHNTGIRMPLNYDGYYLFLQDSIPLQSSALFNHNGLRWSSFNTSADQIEVLKGAGTTLYGSGAVAATINVLSAEPTFTPKGHVSVLTGEDDYAQIKVQHSDKISEDQAFLISASAFQDNGWRDHTARDRQEILAKHIWEIDEDTELKTQFQVSTMTDEMASSLDAEELAKDRTQSGLSDAVKAIDPERDSDFARLSFELTHALNDQLTLSFIPYARYNSNDYIATWRSYTPKTDSNVTSFGLLAKGNWAHDNGNETIFGVDLEHSESETFSYQPIDITVSGGWGPPVSYTAGFEYRDQDITYKNISPYIQHNLMLGDALTVQAGLRYDYNQYELDNHLAETDDDGFGNRQLADRKDKFTSLNPKLGFHYALNDNSGFFGRVAQANRLPTASTMYNLKSGDSASLVGGVKEETSTTVELGYRLQRENLSLSASIYRMTIDDAIVSADDNNGDSYRTNAGETRHQGIELELGYVFSPSWSTKLALSHSKHEFIDYVNDGTNYSGNEIMRAPRNKVGVTVNWTPVSVPGLVTQLQADHIGSYWKDDANSLKAPSYTLFNLKGQYELTPELMLFGRVDNLFDRQYNYQTEFSWGSESFYPGAGRTLKAGLKYNW